MLPVETKTLLQEFYILIGNILLTLDCHRSDFFHDITKKSEQRYPINLLVRGFLCKMTNPVKHTNKQNSYGMFCPVVE